MSRVALATCREIPDLDDGGERLVLAPLAARGVVAEPVVWDDPAVDWSAYDLIVLRGTWDYAERIGEFLGWVEGVSTVTRLHNPEEVVRWNTDKRYLADLAADGVAIVPTTFVSPGEDVSLPTSGEFVVKPTVSAGSRSTARYLAGRDDAAAAGHVGALLSQGRRVMVQPYVESVDRAGETALLFLDGRFSHAIRKGPLLRSGAAPTSGLFAPETIEARTPSPGERAVAEQVLRALTSRFGHLLYARVDLLAGPDGPLLLEVELTEPSLFLDTHPTAPDRFAAAITARLP